MAPDAIFDEFLLNAAKNSLISTIVDKEKDIGDLPMQSILLSFKDLPPEYNHDFIKVVIQISSDFAFKFVISLFVLENRRRYS